MASMAAFGPHSPRGGLGIIYEALSGGREGNTARSEWCFCHGFGGLHRTLNATRQSAEHVGICDLSNSVMCIAVTVLPTPEAALLP